MFPVYFNKIIELNDIWNRAVQVNQQEIDAVEAKLNGQHGLKAALAVAFW